MRIICRSLPVFLELRRSESNTSPAHCSVGFEESNILLHPVCFPFVLEIFFGHTEFTKCSALRVCAAKPPENYPLTETSTSLVTAEGLAHGLIPAARRSS